ncbi:MAG: hypothetical protein GY832_37675 [Chloroflexi bacterium]|nr:hypothetical protein [Chloroflexota bacterium]
MNVLDRYLRDSQKLIGPRTQEKELFDNEVVKWLKEGMLISQAIRRANEKYPDTALKLTLDNLPNITTYYNFLKNYMEFVQRIDPKQNKELM